MCVLQQLNMIEIKGLILQEKNHVRTCRQTRTIQPETCFREEVPAHGRAHHAEKQADFRREYLGFIFQSHNLIPYLNAMENVMLPLAVTRFSADDKYRRATDMLKRVGLPDRMLHLPQQLSGGEQERVAIARALVNSPPLLLADEPTGSLDTTNSHQVMSLLKELHEDGQSIIMVTHNCENLEWFDRTVYLWDGQVEKDVYCCRDQLPQAI